MTMFDDGVQYQIIEKARPLNFRPKYYSATKNDALWTTSDLAGHVFNKTIDAIKKTKPHTLQRKVIGVDPSEGIGVFRNWFPVNWSCIGFDINPSLPWTHRADFTTVSICRPVGCSLIAISNLPFSEVPEFIGAFARDRYDAFGCILSRSALGKFWQHRYVHGEYHLAHSESLDNQKYYGPYGGWKGMNAAFQVWLRQDFKRAQPLIITESPYFKIGISDNDAAFGIGCSTSYTGKILKKNDFHRYERKYIKRIVPTGISEKILRHCVNVSDWASPDIASSTRAYINNAMMATTLHNSVLSYLDIAQH